MNMREKYSGGPKAREKLANTGAKKVRPTIPSVPATKDEIAEIPRAGPPGPVWPFHTHPWPLEQKRLLRGC